MTILGISCYYHDAAAAILRDGKLLAAAQEERFTRIKHDPEFPTHAIDYCLRQAGVAIDQVDYICFYDKPFTKFDRILQTYVTTWPRSFPSFLKAMPVWIKEKIWVPQEIKKRLGYNGEVLFCEHHLSHAASAFLVSPFDEAAILTMDGVGEWDTTTYGAGRGNDLQLFKSMKFPHSLGLFYSAFTSYLGFRVNSAEYKVMGLAPYGRPLYYDLIVKHLIDVKEDGSFKLNMKYFIYDRALRMTGKAFEQLFGQPGRAPESGLEQFHKDVAASLQKITDEVVVKMANHVYTETKLPNLCLAGGVALNCVANSKLLAQAAFKEVFIQPAAGDAGGAIGAAFYIYNTLLGNKREYVMSNAFLGPEFSDEEIAQWLDSIGASYRRLDRRQLLEVVARNIADQNVVGWFQGRMEFGPRALGARSIIADARNAENWQRVNLKIKFRESFRPFAPTVLEERTAEYFDFNRPSPYMLFVAQVREDRRVVPAITHVDGSARLQTIKREDHPLYYDLISEFGRQTGCPVVINTSFNVRGEPIVCTPQDAFRCFMRTEMDYLVIGSFVIDRKEMKPVDGDVERKKVYTLD
ncbi:MAG TPA: carbamoyltransferase [Bacteroidota bacterium]|jgi:carbamoyltransferase|nr:carbamoyltransferase [Bacteroidota bacterium]